MAKHLLVSLSMALGFVSASAFGFPVTGDENLWTVVGNPPNNPDAPGDKTIEFQLQNRGLVQKLRVGVSQVSYNQAKEFATVVAQVNSKVSQYFNLPEHSKASMYPLGSEARVTPDRVIIVPYLWVVELPGSTRENSIFASPKEPEQSHPTWAHEYGHQFLHNNLPADLSFESVMYLIGPYDEFFADLIAVIHAGKGDIVYTSHFFPQKPNPFLSARDFTRDDFDSSIYPELDEHYWFQSVRHFLWTTYLSRATLEPGRVAQIVSKAIFNELRRLKSENPEQIAQITEKSAAKQLLRAVQREFDQSLGR